MHSFHVPFHWCTHSVQRVRVVVATLLHLIDYKLCVVLALRSLYFMKHLYKQAYVPPNVKWSVIDTGNTGEIVDDALPTQNQFVNFS